MTQAEKTGDKHVSEDDIQILRDVLAAYHAGRDVQIKFTTKDHRYLSGYWKWSITEMQHNHVPRKKIFKACVSKLKSNKKLYKVIEQAHLLACNEAEEILTVAGFSTHMIKDVLKIMDTTPDVTVRLKTLGSLDLGREEYHGKIAHVQWRWKPLLRLYRTKLGKQGSGTASAVDRPSD